MSRLEILVGALPVARSEAKKLQNKYNEVKAENEKSWKSYIDRLSEVDDCIAELDSTIKESKRLEEMYGLVSEKPDEEPGKTVVYREASEHFAIFAKQKIVERDMFISIKRDMAPPDDREVQQIGNELEFALKECEEIQNAIIQLSRAEALEA